MFLLLGGRKDAAGSAIHSMGLRKRIVMVAVQGQGPFLCRVGGAKHMHSIREGAERQGDCSIARENKTVTLVEGPSALIKHEDVEHEHTHTHSTNFCVPICFFCAVQI